MKQPDVFRNLLQEGLQQRVEKFIDEMEGNMPTEFEGIEKERLVYNITNGALGRLNMITDTFIGAATLDFASNIRWAQKQKEAQS